MARRWWHRPVIPKSPQSRVLGCQKVTMRRHIAAAAANGTSDAAETLAFVNLRCGGLVAPSVAQKCSWERFLLFSPSNPPMHGGVRQGRDVPTTTFARDGGHVLSNPIYLGSVTFSAG
jgi:hypothetical protein